MAYLKPEVLKERAEDCARLAESTLCKWFHEVEAFKRGEHVECRHVRSGSHWNLVVDASQFARRAFEFRTVNPELRK